MRRALSDAEERAHAEFLHGGHVEDFDDDAKLAQTGRPAGELSGIEHICRFIDQVARPYDAVGDTLHGCPSSLRRGRIGAGEIHFHLVRPLVAFLALGLVAVEPIGAQARAEHEIGDLIALQRTSAELGQDRRLRGGAWDFAHSNATELDQIPILEVALFAGADHDQTGHVQPRRRNDLKGVSALAGEVVRCGGAAIEIADRRQCFLGCPPELEALRAERNENAPDAIVRGKADLESVGHGRSFGRTLVGPVTGLSARHMTRSARSRQAPCVEERPWERLFGGANSLTLSNPYLWRFNGFALARPFCESMKFPACRGSSALGGVTRLREAGTAMGPVCGEVESDGVDRPLRVSHHDGCVRDHTRQLDRGDVVHAGDPRIRPHHQPAANALRLRRHHGAAYSRCSSC